MLTDIEFEKLKEAYWKEATTRNKLAKLNEEATQIKCAIKDLNEDNPMVDITGLSITYTRSVSTSDGHGTLSDDEMEFEITKEDAILILTKRLKKIKAETEALMKNSR